jgi:hypothetical protein
MLFFNLPKDFPLLHPKSSEHGQKFQNKHSSFILNFFINSFQMSLNVPWSSTWNVFKVLPEIICSHLLSVFQWTLEIHGSVPSMWCWIKINLHRPKKPNTETGTNSSPGTYDRYRKAEFPLTFHNMFKCDQGT